MKFLTTLRLAHLACITGLCILLSIPLNGSAETAAETEATPEVIKIPIQDSTLTLKIPAEAAPGKPWLWVGEFGGHLKSLEKALLDQGWHVAYLKFSNKFGSPEEIALWENAYEELHHKRGLAARPALLGISRGGLYVNAWTRLHPDRVSVLYLDNGVCDPRSWPGGFELTTQGKGSKRDWTRYKSVFNFASDEEALEKAVRPTEGFDAAIKNDVLLISVHGTADGTVPYLDNAKPIVEYWEKSGGRVEVFAKEGGRHHPHGLQDVSPLIELLTQESQQNVVDTIAFGSCFNPRDGRSGIFDGILQHEPDVFVFLGDNIYGDTEDMEVLKKKWDELGAVEGFQKLREGTPILATWDDHDYGVNDGGKSYSKREESERIFLDFFQDPADSPRRQREGVYGSYIYGPEGKRCQILLLDTRYFRDELPRKRSKKAEGTIGWYEATEDTSMTLLGEEQWKWLEAQLQVPADIRIIASSVQMLADEKGMENWGHVPHERQRLFDLLKKHKAHHTFAISGDVHFAELSKMDLDGYPFYDLTSSGMSSPRKNWANAINSLRVGEASWEMNAGLIEIDWQEKRITLSAINPEGEKLFSETVKLSDLVFEN